ncbi:MAG: cysteine desulfurase NifS [Candidatus Moranbacteria bacterium CG_4_9_14_3_um_filter_42_9]|nr:MAG: cysteine desulfurase NifS [Candidatus Moranbacteria bacterium CG_4_9_14_3_um_filter_42_9]
MAKKIYLDYAATTPMDKEVFSTMKPYFSEKFGNAMSIHSFGQEALAAIDKARSALAEFLHATSAEIIFTSGATESNNLAVKGIIKSYQTQSGSQKRKPHIITTSFEHHCVLYACRSMAKEGLAEVTYVKPGKDGLIKVADIKRAIRPNTILVSVMYVNNEIGTAQPIKEIGKLIKLTNDQRPTTNHKIIFHTDATQAINYFDCNIDKLGVDLLSMSAHKIYGPKGVGMLYIRKGTPIRHIQDGGDQEYRMRAGTHNVAGIVGLGKAIELVTRNAKRETPRIKKLRDYLIKRVLKEIPKVKLNGSKIKRSPNNANFTFADVEGEGLILSLDMEGIAASTGSACSSGALTPSHVLLSIGLKPEEAHGSLRMTLGKYTTKQDIEIAVNKLKAVIGRLRKISGRVLSDYYSKK